MTRVILQPSKRGFERILIFGEPGTGKTSDAVQVAQKCLPDGARMRVVDTDNAICHVAEAFGTQVAREYSFVDGKWEPFGPELDGNIDSFHATDWLSFRLGLQHVASISRPTDWLCVDSISLPWNWVQDFIVQQTHGEDLADWLVGWRADQIARNKSGRDSSQALLADGAWQLINQQWAIVNNLATNPPCHVLFTCEAKSIRSDVEAPTTRSLFAQLGFKPDTQKSIAHKVRTVIWRERTTGVPPKYLLSVLKDWGRDITAQRSEIDLIGVLVSGGWRPCS